MNSFTAILGMGVAVIAATVTAVIFKLSADQEELRRLGFFFAVGLSIAILVPAGQTLALRDTSPQVVYGVFSGASVVAIQIVLLIVFREKLGWAPWFGILLICGGVMLVQFKSTDATDRSAPLKNHAANVRPD